MGGADPFTGILCSEKLPDYEYLLNTADSAASVLEHEDGGYRPADSDGNPGGLLDFTGGSRMLSVVVPDIHARPSFLENLLAFRIPAGSDPCCGGQTVISALEKKSLRVICVGDIMHTERVTAERWRSAAAEFGRGEYSGPSMRAEMRESLSVLACVMELKIRFPSVFHILKGNHENVMNRTGGGDFSFCKYADEGRMVREFISSVYGDDVLYMISCWERFLPLSAVIPGCVISHAEPERTFSRRELVDARLESDVVRGLTWTANGAAEEGSAAGTAAALLPGFTGSPFFICGHRPVSGDFAVRQNGRVFQIHNPDRQNVALVRSDGEFCPETDIVGVNV